MTKHLPTKVISRVTEFEGWRKLETITLQHASLKKEGYAEPMKREVYHCGPAAIILLYLPETDQILMNEQYRVGAYMTGEENPWLYECAAGVMDEGETPEETARREAKEETGCDVTDIEYIGKLYPSPGATDEIFHLFCGRIAAAEAGHYGMEDEGEEIRTHLMKADDVIKMLDDGKIKNGATFMCLQWFARHHDRLRKKWGDK